MCTAFKMQVNSAFQMSPGMTVTCSSGWGDRHTGGIFKLCATTPRLCLYFRFWTSFMSLWWMQGFWNGVKFFGKSVDPSHSVYM